jgi:hypothetical protein
MYVVYVASAMLFLHNFLKRMNLGNRDCDAATGMADTRR